MRFIATCKLGLEALVTRELKDLNISVEQTLDGRVVFLGGFDAMVRAQLWLRTAERVLMEIGAFPATSFEELFEGTKALAWKDYIVRDAFIHVNGKSAKSQLFSVSDCQKIVKKAIVENLKQAYKTQVLPETGREIIIEAGLLRDMATIALDCSGAGLARRGYRTWNVAAPISETLGAAIVMLSRFRPEMPLRDPMCGSGTMPIEAAMLAQHMAPGLNRSFAAEQWPFLEQKLWERAREEARAAYQPMQLDVEGSDIDPRCIDVCKKHAKKAGVMLRWSVRPLQDLHVERPNGVIVCNPPYGERLSNKQAVSRLYGEMRTVFDRLDHWSVNIITANQEFERLYGKRADKRRKLSNGGMQCQLYQYFSKRDS